MSKVRIINDKTGDVKHVSSYVANQPDQLKAYGYRIEDLKVVAEKTKIIIHNPIVSTEAESLFEMEESFTESPKPKGKPGPKPKNQTVTE